jgi:glycosyltransferase involved in cell wall biosynthesis
MANRKILFVAFGDLAGTSCLRAVELAKGLRGLGWEAQLAVPHSDSNRRHGEQCGLDPHYFDASHRGFFGGVSKLIRGSEGFVHLLNPKEKAMALLGTYSRDSGRGVRFVLDWEDWSTFWETRSLVRRYKEWREGWLVKRAALVVTASKWLGGYIQDRYGRDSLYLPYACLPKAFPDVVSDAEQGVIVGMGNLYSSWDHDLLVEAVGELKSRGMEPKVRWIGDGDDMGRTRSRVAQLGLSQFELPGYLGWEQMLRELRGAHSIVFPIRNKPLNLARCPFKCFQFAQARRPVITSNIGEVRAILGDLATYVEPTVAGYADGIAASLSGERSQDVAYNLTSHRWELRALELSKALEVLS